MQHEPKNEQYGEHRNMLSFANAPSNPGALQNASPSTFSDTKAVCEDEPTKPRLCGTRL